MRGSSTIDVILVSTPFQLLSAFEATKHFESEAKRILVLIYSKRSDSQHCTQQLEKTAKLLGFSNAVWIDRAIFSRPFGRVSKWYALAKLQRVLKQPIRSLYIGDIRCRLMRFLAQWFHFDRVTFLDDGHATVSVLSHLDIQAVASHDRKQHACVNSFIKLVEKKNRNEEKCCYFFTAIQFSGKLPKNIGIYIHQFQYLRTEKYRLNRGGHYASEVIYFGSKLSEAGVMSLADEIYLISWVSDFYRRQGLRVVYIPHRADCSVKIDQIASLGIRVMCIDLPAELYVLTLSSQPNQIAAASSTVLSSLKNIAPDLCLTSFRMPPSSIVPQFRPAMGLVYEYLRSIKIEIIDVEVGANPAL